MKVHLWSDPRWEKRVRFWNEELPSFSGQNQIPKFVRQVYIGKSLNSQISENISTFSELNRDWTFELYDEPAIYQFLDTHYPSEITRLFQKINPIYPAARADLFRYLLIYAVGGVYLDLKSRFNWPISKALNGNERFILSQWRNGPQDFHAGIGLHPDLESIPGGEFQQWHVISVAGHPFLRAVIAQVLANVEMYSPWRLNVGGIGVLRTTGPITYTRAIAPLLQRGIPYTRIANEAERGLEFSYYDPKGLFHGRHYTELTEPIALRGALGTASGKVFQSALLFKQYLASTKDNN
jgi:hypothetical protein